MLRSMRNPAPSARTPHARSFACPEPASGLLLRRALSREDWSAVRTLRFAALAREGDVEPASLPVQPDAYDGAPGTTTFVLADRGRAIGSTRASHPRDGRPFRLPSSAAFGREIEAQLGGASVVEASLTVLDASADRTLSLLRLFKAHVCVCAGVDADWLVAAVREPQMGFYRRVFDMEILTGAAKLAGLAMPRVLMGLRYRERAPALLRRFPALAPREEELARFAAGAALRFGGEEPATVDARARSRARDACA
jgi:hypothetical protein